MLSLTLALEDVLEIGDSREALAGQQLPVEEYENLHYLLGKRYRDKRKAAADAPAEEVVETKLSVTETPIVAYALIKKFLILRKRVELIKREWGKRRLGIEGIDTAANYKYFV
ncbi:unnamed protein product [Dibothriocephalus latus]|uniref:Uncharacterized protein n=1 Tax=Dibothriocephalus latus TaxID=60516 RepID=A0A3P7MG73_DIBLA|nr:unnamed protein product [Dibothriocephalus latus]